MIDTQDDYKDTIAKYENWKPVDEYDHVPTKNKNETDYVSIFAGLSLFPLCGLILTVIYIFRQ